MAVCKVHHLDVPVKKWNFEFSYFTLFTVHCSLSKLLSTHNACTSKYTIYALHSDALLTWQFEQKHGLRNFAIIFFVLSLTWIWDLANNQVLNITYHTSHITYYIGIYKFYKILVINTVVTYNNSLKLILKNFDKYFFYVNHHIDNTNTNVRF